MAKFMIPAGGPGMRPRKEKITTHAGHGRPRFFESCQVRPPAKLTDQEKPYNSFKYLNYGSTLEVK